MKFTVDRDSLLDSVQNVSGVVCSKALPILGNVLMEVREGALTLTGSNLEVEIKANIDVDMFKEGSVAVAGRKLLDICRALDSGKEIKINLDKSKVKVCCGKSKFTLATAPAQDFPILDSSASELSVTLEAKDLKSLIDKTALSMGNKDVRYYLNGLMFEFGKGYVKAVSTDGHRLSVVKLDADTEEENIRQIIIPRKGVMELAKFLGSGDITININGNYLQTNTNRKQFSSKLIDGRFPDYEGVIPKNSNNIITIDREEIKSVLQRTAILSNENIKGVEINVNESCLKVKASNVSNEEALEIIDVEDYSGDALDIGFNALYLIDAMSNIEGEHVNIRLKDGSSSALITPVIDDGSLFVVMPLRM